MTRLALTAVAASLLFGLTGSGGENWTPFTVDWSREVHSPADVSFLLDAPAAKNGPIRVQEGHLAYPDGRRFRIWGVNATAAATVPAKEHAVQIARRFAQVGINCVRFHFLDRFAPDGLLAAGREDSLSFDPVQLDRFDFFVSELKKVGIYSNINLNVGRTYRDGDGVKDNRLLGFAKALTYFDPRLLELQKDYASRLLKHRNAYTDCEYRSEPAVVTVEIVNENSLVEAWFSGRLLGKNTTKNPGTWTDITASYEKDLTARFNEWLGNRCDRATLDSFRKEAAVGPQDLIPRLVPDQFNKASEQRFRTEASFYMEIEAQYFDGMRKFLKEELAVQAPIVGTSDHNHGRSGYPLLSATSVLDIQDGHVYWQHPRYLTGERGARTGFEITNTPMVDDPLNSTVVQLSRTAASGRPYTVSEVGHPFPNEYACEGIPILAAYAALQDWDGIYWYTLAHRDVAAAGDSAIGHFDLFPDPVKMTQLAAGAMMFLRPDVRPAEKTITRSYSREQVVDSLRLPYSERPFFTPGFSTVIPLRSGVRWTSLDGQPTAALKEDAADPIVSDTGELSWFHAQRGSGLVAVNTPRSQALVGYIGSGGKETGQMKASTETGFCAVTLSSLDENPIARSGKLLLTCTSRVENSNMVWTANRKSLEKWGTAPTRIDAVQGDVLLKNLEKAAAITAQPLDGSGSPLGSPVAAAESPEGWTITLGNPATTWMVVEVRR